MNQDLATIAEKVARGERLTKTDGLLLYESQDLLWLGKLARQVKQRKTGEQVYFNVNRHINLSNICMSRCKFCAFGVDKDAREAYVMDPERVMAIAGQAAALPDLTELHIVSSLHPDLPFAYYLDMIRRLHQAHPHLHIQAFTAVEIAYFAKISGMSVQAVLAALKEAGLGSLPGGGAEVFSPRVRAELCAKKASGEEWLEVMRTAHRLGLKTNATMLYGHIETVEERIDHLLALRALQDETGGFQSFIPLPFHPENTRLSEIRRTTAWEDLKTIAIARLMLDNFAHIKAFWIMLSVPLAQVSLTFGVDDLDGTVMEEKITHAAGAKTAQGITKEDLLKLIREAGYVPAERDTVYNVLRTYEGSVAGAS
ncbi:aminofutalosine synthase MqnE [Acetonema longum]|uniref:Aminodeoxyfutalosine synthase n=1 Tax=Acetonema longum DSM 6540 TaxID=1009370 RepID=F7NGH3_9FIRM|nr:aminofutalosine synthase MqnE [Acetonema longum]EGO64777.1 radical SAM protein [Acetonema longum DSM 6540]